MQSKNTHFKKKWLLKPTEHFLLYFYTGCTKAKHGRKLRRLCKVHNLELCVLPSAFRLKSLFYAQGPSISSVVGKDLNFSSFKALTLLNSTSFFKQQRAFPSSCLKNFTNLLDPLDLCNKFVQILSLKQKANLESKS
jgi:hypothetical protein